MAKKKMPETVARTVAIDLVEHIPIRHFMRFEVLAGQINGEAYYVYAPMGSSNMFVEIAGRQFSIEAAELVKTVFLQLIRPAPRKTVRKR